MDPFSLAKEKKKTDRLMSDTTPCHNVACRCNILNRYSSYKTHHGCNKKHGRAMCWITSFRRTDVSDPKAMASKSVVVS